MSAYVLTPLAKADIFDIWGYIAENSESAADRGLRFWTLNRYPAYTIVYRPHSISLQIIAVLHSKRNFRRILNERR